MSRLYASIDSDSRKTQATSRGHKHVSAHTRGWSAGVAVEASIDAHGRDQFHVYLTGGSNGGSRSLLGVVYDSETGPTWEGTAHATAFPLG
jgi:hypothetical protein